jgi:hypothetical protein
MSISFRHITRWVSYSAFAVVALFVIIHYAISHKIETIFNSRGISFEKKTRSLLGLNYYQLTWKQNRAERVHIPFSYPPDITLYNAHAYISHNTQSDLYQSSTEVSSLPLTIHVKELTIFSSLLPNSFEHFSGTLVPKLSIANESISIQKNEDVFSIKGMIPHERFPNGLPFSIHKSSKELTFYSDIPAHSYKHTLISNTSITIPPSHVRGTLIENNINATIDVLDSSIHLSGTLSPAPLTLDLDWNAEISLETLHTIFPLSEDIALSGSFQAEGILSWPQRDWSIILLPTELQISGLLFDSINLRHGSFSHTSPSTLTSHLSGPQTPNWTPLSQLGWMTKTTVAAEDSAFWIHHGYSINSMQEAINDYRSKNKLRGGSTITQQLAKNLFLTSERTIERKIHELFYTLSLEHYLSKEEILTTYLNVVEFGPEVHGIKAASNLYFLKKPQNLSLLEACYLSSVLPAPTRFFQYAQKAVKTPRRRTDRILKNLHDAKIISTSTFHNNLRTKLLVIPPTD